jgi:dUTP pyrophosphatase
MKFEIVRSDCRKFSKSEITLPTRKTENSAGYDLYSNENAWMYPAHEMHVFWTDVKAELDDDLFLQISVRSSLAAKGLCLANGIGIIDSDYYSNESNDGNIGIMLVNIGNKPIQIQKGDRIAQGIILAYHVMDDDNTDKKRLGGLGSTGQ